MVAADGDLAALRATPAFARLLPTLVGAPRGATSSGAASPAGAAAAAPPPPSLVAEARSPFRLLRLFFLAALLGGALIASVVTLPRLAAALGGREGAPEAGATGLNAAVDAAVLAASALLLQRELRAKADDEKRAGDEETVAGLRVLLQPPAPAGAPAAGAPPPPPQPASLRSLRGSLRPVLCAGFHGSARAVGERAREVGPALAARGLLLVLLDDAGDGEGDGGGGGGDEDAGGLAGAARAKGFGAAPARPAAPAAPSAASAAPPFAPAWQARPEGGAEWRAWAAGARASLVLPPGAALFCALDLDGAIVLQGPGPPPLEQLLKQTPTLEKQGARKGANAQAAR